LSSNRLALGPCFQSARFNFVVESPGFLGPCFQSARFNFVIESLGFLGPGFQPRRLKFVIGSPFWGRVFSRHGSTLSSNRHFRASAGSRKFPYHLSQPLSTVISRKHTSRVCLRTTVRLRALELSDKRSKCLREITALAVGCGWYGNFRFLALVLCQHCFDG
jgi:hypothetical protein